jgi:quinolinate synthase
MIFLISIFKFLLRVAMQRCNEFPSSGYASSTSYATLKIEHKTHPMFSPQALQAETTRLHRDLQHVGFNEGYCKIFAPLTLEINRLKKAKNAVILAHSYMTPDILYGVADFQGDSYQLSKKAQETKADVIVFAGVRFMAETAKILNPTREVLLPSIHAGCSLADSITAADIRQLKKKYPGVPVVSYVNTSAEVKAESDACCTSANALQVIEAFPQDKIIFLPDEFMAKNIQKMTKKKLISWKGRCIVHEDFKPKKVSQFKHKYPGLKVLAHTECSPQVVKASDFSGGTGDMIRFVRETKAPAYMMVTECGFSDRMRVEFPKKEFLGMCGLCPYMKQNTLSLILQVLKNPRQNQKIEIEEKLRKKAERALLKMFELTN